MGGDDERGKEVEIRGWEVEMRRWEIRRVCRCVM